MPICPRCRTEYTQPASRCEDCDVDLVDTLPEQDAPDPGSGPEMELVELAEFPNYPEADMIQELLESNGIRTVLRGEIDPIGVASGATPSTLLVSRVDLPQALQMYKNYYAGEEGVEGSGSEPEDSDSEGKDPDI